MLTCAEVSPLLDDLVDDSLADADRQAIEAHVASCLPCRAELAGLRALQASANVLSERIEPPRDLWPAIGDALDGPVVRPLDPRGGWVRVRQRVLVAAAAGLVVLSAGLTAVLVRPGEGVTVVSAQLPEDLAALEARYVAAARDLESALAAGRGGLDSHAVRVVRTSLRVIDQAIEEARAALAGAPGDAELARMLWTGYRQKIDLLQRANRL